MLTAEQLSPENISAFGSIVTAGMSIWIAVVANNFSRRVARVEAEREITSSFMAMNFEQWSNAEVADLYRRTRHPDKTTDYVRIVAQTRCRLGILYSIWRAESEGVIPNACRDNDFDGYVRLMVTTSAPAFEEALAAVAFNKAFLEYVDRSRRSQGLADYTGGVQPSAAAAQ